MLRITIHRAEDDLVMKLEGCVSGPWVGELDACWRGATTQHAGRLMVDLRGVCHVDAGGRVVMARMHEAGASFMTSGCVMPEVVREVTGRSVSIVPASKRT
jgi:hypothetical protein